MAQRYKRSLTVRAGTPRRAAGAQEVLLWRLWKRGTAWFSATHITLVDQAMNRKTRRSAPWRYDIWFYAWLLAAIAYTPVGLLIDTVVTSGLHITGAAQNFVVYGPTLLMGAAAFYCMVRSWFSEPVPPTPWASEEEANAGRARRARSTTVSRWIGGVLISAAVLWRIILHFHR
jgi:hypothetical protein